MHIIPQLRDLQTRFGSSLVVIGVHSPKFAAEQSDADVRAAVARYHLDHPVVNDSHLTLWRTLGIQAWPTVVLVDPDGYVAHVVEGEGVEAGMMPALTEIGNLYRAAGRLDERPLALLLESSKYKPTLLSFPGKILADPAGKRFFIADSGHNRIVVAGVDGHVQEIIGSGAPGRADGPAATASFSNPQGMTLAGSLLYVADTNNHLIRSVDVHTHTVATVAGTGRQAADLVAGGPALRQPISSPWDVNWFKGALYIAMAGDHRIWRYDPTGKWVGVYAGTGQEDRRDGPVQQAEFAQPSGLANDGHYLYVADSESSSIRRIDTAAGLVTTLAGGGLFDFGHLDAAGLAARFQHPLGITYLAGKLYISDTYNSDIRVLDLASRAVTTL
ncbi:MAG: hypothetical protein LC772_00700, partial [Chloroflexi bacterium]|nr:hypothetical protein [Chloroflexota bacterium]